MMIESQDSIVVGQKKRRRNFCCGVLVSCRAVSCPSPFWLRKWMILEHKRVVERAEKKKMCIRSIRRWVNVFACGPENSLGVPIDWIPSGRWPVWSTATLCGIGLLLFLCPVHRQGEKKLPRQRRWSAETRAKLPTFSTGRSIFLFFFFLKIQSEWGPPSHVFKVWRQQAKDLWTVDGPVINRLSRHLHRWADSTGSHFFWFLFYWFYFFLLCWAFSSCAVVVVLPFPSAVFSTMISLCLGPSRVRVSYFPPPPPDYNLMNCVWITV